MQELPFPVPLALGLRRGGRWIERREVFVGGVVDGLQDRQDMDDGQGRLAAQQTAQVAPAIAELAVQLLESEVARRDQPAQEGAVAGERLVVPLALGGAHARKHDPEWYRNAKSSATAADRLVHRGGKKPPGRSAPGAGLPVQARATALA